jgi:abortive infection bacteriophage resistance protein
MANLIPFTKRFESSENLINLLESRGLQICDRNKAIQYLDNIGYYRLSAYMYPLLKMPKTALKTDVKGRYDYYPYENTTYGRYTFGPNYLSEL